MFNLTKLFAAFNGFTRMRIKSECKFSFSFMYSTKSSPSNFDEDTDTFNSLRLHSRGPFKTEREKGYLYKTLQYIYINFSDLPLTQFSIISSTVPCQVVSHGRAASCSRVEASASLEMNIVAPDQFCARKRSGAIWRNRGGHKIKISGG